ncbi:hypothetical protein [uncultured Roseibium sp.]|uniref:hypothetical protein n=1 Tax=uncultured Roseibium sp. TaxID=1936171 RepID=UPI00260C9182|nr:hypothetical protein [uncultured Roseibium sp.]
MFIVANRSGFLSIDNGEFYFANNPKRAFKFSTKSEADNYARDFGGKTKPASDPRHRSRTSKREFSFLYAA